MSELIHAVHQHFVSLELSVISFKAAESHYNILGQGMSDTELRPDSCSCSNVP